VMNKRLADREFLAGKYSIADIACIGWTLSWKRQGQDIEEFPNLKRWQEAIQARPAAKRGLAVRVPDVQPVNMQDPAVRAVLFNQRARTG
jgi:GSH-dependent disulfide-bond oxidoreductase